MYYNVIRAGARARRAKRAELKIDFIFEFFGRKKIGLKKKSMSKKLQTNFLEAKVVVSSLQLLSLTHTLFKKMMKDVMLMTLIAYASASQD